MMEMWGGRSPQDIAVIDQIDQARFGPPRWC